MTDLVPALDLVVVAAIVAGAVVFLVWNLGIRKAKPACHTTAGGKTPGADGGDVVVGASLARGLERARSRNAVQK